MTADRRFDGSARRGAAAMLRDLLRRPASLVRNLWNTHKPLILDASPLVTATVISQGLRVAVLPALSRLYTPAEFGVFQVFTSILGTLSLISAVGYDKAVVFASSERRATSALLVGCFMAIVMATLSWGGAAWFGAAAAAALKSPGLETYLLTMLPLGMVAIGFGESARYYAMRQRWFSLIARALIAQAVLTAVLQIGSGFLPNVGSGGLIVARVSGIVLLGVMLWAIIGRATSGEIRKTRWKNLGLAALRYRKFPLVVTPTTILSQAVYIGPVVLVAKFFSPRDVGFFGVAMLLMSAPMQFVGTAVEQVFYRNAMRERSATGSCLASVRQTFFLLAAISGAIGIALLLAKPFIGVVLGSDWATVGDLVLWMIPMVVLNLVAMPLLPAFVVTGRQSLVFVHQAVRTTCSMSAIWIAAAYTGDLRMTIMAFMLVEVVMHLVAIGLVFYVSRATPPLSTAGSS
jgi:O-antigen/teichoic acid export membrane protein